MQKLFVHHQMEAVSTYFLDRQKGAVLEQRELNGNRQKNYWHTIPEFKAYYRDSVYAPKLKVLP